MDKIKIAEYLLENNIKASTAGFHYLIDVIEMACKCGRGVKIGTLRWAVADKYCVSTASVERAIRYALISSGYTKAQSEFVSIAVIRLESGANDSGSAV